jgi:hypothetical protein
MPTPEPSTLATVYALQFGELTNSGNEPIPLHVSAEVDEVHEAYRVLICADGAAGPEFIALAPCSADILAHALHVAAARVRAEIALYNQFVAWH